MSWDDYIQSQMALAKGLHNPPATPFEVLGLLQHKCDALSSHLSGSGHRNNLNKRIEQAQTLVHSMVIASRALETLYGDIDPRQIINYYNP
jgi:hypothetical protein